MMTVRIWFNHLSILACCLLPFDGCGHREGSGAAAVARSTAPATSAPTPVSSPAPVSTVIATPHAVSVPTNTKTYSCPSGDIQFNYPADWHPDKAKTAVFAITAPDDLQCSLNLDVPRLPWHPAGLLTVGMIAMEYERDLKKNQIHDAVKEEDAALNIPAAQARRVTASGHTAGNTLIDMAVIVIHADRVYILSADCDERSRIRARKTLDDAVASLKWSK